jgi:hypothetical protein
MRRVLLSIVVAVIVAASTASTAHALLRAVAMTFVGGGVEVTLLDTNGTPLTRSLFDGVVVGPSMAPAVTTFAVENTGDLTAYYAINVAITGRAGPGDLTECLELTVRESVSGSVVYEGPLDQLHIRGGLALAPTAEVNYRITTTWLSRSGDNCSQGSSTSFDLVVTAIAA